MEIFYQPDINYIDVNVIINDTYPIKSQLDSRFTFGEKLGREGAHGEIKIACFQEDCKYIAKIIPIGTQFNEPNCYTEKDLTRNELVITKKMSEAGVAPMIYDMSLSDTEGIMIMNTYDGTLTDLLWLYQTNKSIPIDQILQLVQKLIAKIHQEGIIHRDLSTDNILYTKDGLFAITDFGLSINSTSEELREIDRSFFRGMRDVYYRISNGETFEDPESMMIEAIPMRLPFIRFFWNGHECSDWQ